MRIFSILLTFQKSFHYDDELKQSLSPDANSYSVPFWQKWSWFKIEIKNCRVWHNFCQLNILNLDAHFHCIKHNKNLTRQRKKSNTKISCQGKFKFLTTKFYSIYATLWYKKICATTLKDLSQPPNPVLKWKLQSLSARKADLRST